MFLAPSPYSFRKPTFIHNKKMVKSRNGICVQPSNAVYIS